ncbi:MAG: ABC transporter permease [Candidatus Acetothermia bacterium]
MFFDYLGLSWQSIKNRRLRSWLTILGIVIGVTAIVTLISIGQGVQDSILNEFNKLGYNTITVVPGNVDTGRGGFSNAAGDSVDSLSPSVIAGLEEIDSEGLIRTETGLVNSDELEGQAFLRVTGLSETILTDFDAYFNGFPIGQGELFSFTGEENQVVLGTTVAGELGVSVGESIQIEGRDFTVTGTLQPDEETDGGFNFYGDLDSGLFVPYGTMNSLYGGGDTASIILIELSESANVSAVAERIEGLYEGRDSAATTITTEEISKRVNNALGTIQIALAGIAAISLLVGGVGVMNTMYTAVLERTREIGVMKAVGAKNSSILNLFLIESGLLGLFGGVLGTLFGVGLSLIAGHFIQNALAAPFSPSFNPALIIGAIAFSFFLGAISGVFPARQASKLQPVEALRYE